jgi:hypothetical protein
MEFIFAMLIIALFVLSLPAIYFLIMSAIADRVAGKRKSPSPGGGFDVLPPAMSLRYVVLHHTGVPTPHFDLMFETDPGSPLTTWRSPTWPIIEPALLERLADHRRDYLEYEGSVSNDRGQVHRVAAGIFRFESRTDHRWVIITHSGQKLTFLRQDENPNWRVEVGQNPQSGRLSKA